MTIARPSFLRTTAFTSDSRRAVDCSDSRRSRPLQMGTGGVRSGGLRIQADREGQDMPRPRPAMSRRLAASGRRRTTGRCAARPPAAAVRCRVRRRLICRARCSFATASRVAPARALQRLGRSRSAPAKSCSSPSSSASSGGAAFGDLADPRTRRTFQENVQLSDQVADLNAHAAARRRDAQSARSARRRMGEATTRSRNSSARCRRRPVRRTIAAPSSPSAAG